MIPGLIAPTHGIVSAVIPAAFDSYLRVERSDGAVEDVALFESLAVIGAERTATPDVVGFGIWEGWGFESTGVLTSYRAGTVSGRVRRWRRGRATAQQPVDALRRELGLLPRLDLPIRSYYLVTGPIEAAIAMTAPPWGQFPQLPDLWWPLDRAWFVAGDTDLDWIYVAGTTEHTDAIVGLLGGRCQAVSPLDPIT